MYPYGIIAWLNEKQSLLQKNRIHFLPSSSVFSPSRDSFFSVNSTIWYCSTYNAEAKSKAWYQCSNSSKEIAKNSWKQAAYSLSIHLLFFPPFLLLQKICFASDNYVCALCKNIQEKVKVQKCSFAFQHTVYFYYF